MKVKIKEEKYVLYLSEKEVRVLRDLCGSVSGAGYAREVAGNFCDLFEELGFEYDFDNLYFEESIPTNESHK